MVCEIHRNQYVQKVLGTTGNAGTPYTSWKKILQDTSYIVSVFFAGGNS
jgi:hypothetical protein